MRHLAIAALLALSGCATSMVCRPIGADGAQRCDPVVYTPAASYSYARPEDAPGYAPAYLPYEPPRRRHVWVMDTPHWEPGDE